MFAETLTATAPADPVPPALPAKEPTAGRTRREFAGPDEAAAAANGLRNHAMGARARSSAMAP